MQSQQQQSHFNNPTNGDSFPFQSNQAHNSRCRGSLPLKKRRYHEITLYHSHHHLSHSNNDGAAVTNSSVSSVNSTNTASTSSTTLLQNTDMAKSGLEQLVSAPCNTATMNACAARSTATTDEKFAALALVAAATASSGVSGDKQGLEFESPYALPSVAATSQALSMGYAPLSAASFGASVGITPTAASLISSAMTLSNNNSVNVNDMNPNLTMSKKQKQQQVPTNRNKDTKPSVTKNGQQRQRVNHPPLSAPIPGGCHGRTSRNNSYCRRTPCYNGSNYCKLHYQQYMNNGESSKSNNKKINNTGKKERSKGEEKGAKNKKSLNNTTEGVGGTGTGEDTNQNSQTQRNHQDKRYNGLCADEVQCLATTTRGRPCAYVAVSGTKYCHLHCDYDTNPPPRRGGGGGNGQKTKSSNAGLSTQNNRIVPTCTIFPNNVQNLMTIAKIASMQVSNNSITTPTLSSTSSVDALSTSQSNSRMIDELKLQGEMSKGNDKSKDSILPQTVTTTTSSIYPPPKYPLLNSIPSDKWSNKQVLIGTGPLIDHVGRVTKWGNGWVTVATTTSGNNSVDNDTGVSAGTSTEILHNRRAIELFLLPDSATTAPNNYSIGGLLSGNQPNTDVENNGLKSNYSFNNIKNKDEVSSQKTAETKQDNVVDAENALIPSKSSILSKEITEKVIKEEVKELKEEGGKIETKALKSESTKVVDRKVTGEYFKQSSEAQNNDCPNHKKIDNIEEVQDHVVCDSFSKDVEASVEKVVSDISDTSSSIPLHDKPSSKHEGEIGDSSLKSVNAKKPDGDEKVDQSLSLKDTEDDEKSRLLNNASTSEETEPKDDIMKTPDGRKLTLMEELILAQTGRRVKNVDLALYSGGGRTIKKPKKYEDKTLIKKKRNKQQSDSEHDDEILSPKRKKIINSQKVRLSSSPNCSDGAIPNTRKDASKDASHSVVADSQEERRRIEKVKA